MNSYRDRPDAIRALVEDDRVHRDLYLSEELFALEQERFFARTWLYVGHASQVPKAGDYWALELAGRPVLMVRQPDDTVRVFYNRCAHKGSRLVTDESGNTGRFFRCPYHAWTYKLDGAPLAIPLKAGYEGTRLKECESGQGLTELKNTVVYRDFVFVRLAEHGPDFDAYFGGVLQAIDNMVDRSPEGRLTVGGGVIRSLIHCNWKMYLENINDTVHVLSAHESATQAADALWQGHAPDEPKPMAMEQILPFGSGYDFFDRMGGRVFANGHSVLGVNFSLHSKYAALPEYEAAMRAAHGAERAADILQRSPQNSVFFPSLSVKGSPQAIRVIRPLAAGRTLIEAWSFRAAGAPDLLFERAMSYNRLVFSPMSVVAHDDVHLFESMQQGLRAEGNEWVSLHRNFDAAEMAEASVTTNGTNELLMRNQFRAWAKFMAPETGGRVTDPADFIAEEAALLDAGRFDDWLALFTEDGHYWVPLLGAAQADPLAHNSIAYEDRLLLQLRVDRLKNPRAHSQHPASRCQHVLQRSVLERDDAAGGELLLRTPFLYVEARGDDQVLLAGTCRHRLVRTPAGLAIREKRIDLLQAGQALPAIQLFI